MPEERDLRVWRVRQNGVKKESKRYKVDDVKGAMAKLRELSQQDLKNTSVHWNVGGLHIFENGEWREWYDDDTGMGIDEMMNEIGE